jgi:hypothetical protein
LVYHQKGGISKKKNQKGRKERLNNILISFVWFIIKKERKESFWVGPTKKINKSRRKGKEETLASSLFFFLFLFLIFTNACFLS